MLSMLRRRGWRVAISLILVAIEAAVGVVVPFAIGLAVQDWVEGSSRGVIFLAATGAIGTAAAAIRRLHDVRFYGAVRLDATLGVTEQHTALSVKAARVAMLGEVVDFLEYSLPDVVASVLAFVGVLIFLATLDVGVFIAALMVAAAIAAAYAFTTSRTLRLNRAYNDEAERQVDVLGRSEAPDVRRHISLLNSWMVKMSDLDVVSFAISGVLATALQVYAVIVASGREMEVGSVLSLVMYVVEFSMLAAILPSAWQQYLRLRDILARLRAPVAG
ncbi:ABC transporter six-transmembrane domain-containing protein [Microbacterium horticulturae]|uniref:ABC transporter six-transmembrane domain-containing protein n=1 Tax=Microbacterium horticulturae TaxID=3028316 RepID=A0ABY8BTW2_9MICO|nr:ABC transporter six-transmembrane domain-containing protein [Microbacterium sp. KACC 23027]WEG07604.1 ABC transporter six-transmembrane domain-containing protein [Microbacterium sp. KACC 23027]